MKIKQASRGVLCILSVFFVSCASDVANRYYGAATYPAKSPRDVELLSSLPTRPHVIIADFQSRGEGAESLRRKAAKIGADAIIVSHLGGQYSLSEEWAGEDRMGNTFSRIVGTAIKYKDQ